MTEALTKLLAGDAPQQLPDELRDQLEAELRSALEAQQFGEVAEWVEAQFAAQPTDFRLRFLTAVLQEIEEDPRRAAVTYRDLGRALADAGDWATVRSLCLRALPLRPDDRLARLLVRAWEHLEPLPERDEDLALARELCPDSPDVLWDASRKADAAGQTAEAEALACRAMLEFAKIKDEAATEEALMRALESESDDTYRQLAESLPVLARSGLPDQLTSALEFLEPELDARKLHQATASSLETILTESDEHVQWRPLYVTTIISQLGGEDVVGELVRSAGLADEEIPFREALQRFNDLSALRAGAYVEHNSWGLGHVAANNGETLVVDFEERKGHQMSIDMAIRSLRTLPAELLRVRAFADAEALQREAEEDPVAVLAYALTEAGGEAGTQDLRRALDGIAVPKGGWSRWWTKARKAVAGDPRVDDSDAYRQVYRLGSATEEQSFRLPPLDASKGLRPAVAAIGRLLKQHPDAEEAASKIYGPELMARLDATRDYGERLCVLPLLSKWYPERTADWTATLNEALELHIGATSVTAEGDQSALLALGLAGDAWLDTVFSALPTRFKSVREQALAAVRERADDAFPERVLQVLSDGRGRPHEAVALADLALKGIEPLGAIGRANPWHLFLGTISALSVELSPPAKRRALALLAPDGPLAKVLTGKPCPEPPRALCQIAVVRDGLTEPSFRALAAFLDAVEATDLAERVHARLAPPVRDTPDDALSRAGLRLGVTYMMRETYERYCEELRNLQHQLSVELPQAIKVARELGDLKENAEYHAAREAQGVVGSQVAGLKQLLESVVYIEDIEPSGDVITLGMQVQVRHTDTDRVQTVWLLGEGDGHYGDEVVSYTAKLGECLLGRTVGDEVEMDVDGEISRLEVLAFGPRLPGSDDDQEATDA